MSLETFWAGTWKKCRGSGALNQNVFQIPGEQVALWSLKRNQTVKWLMRLGGSAETSLHVFPSQHKQQNKKKRERERKPAEGTLQWSHITEQTVFLPILCCGLLLSTQSANCGQFCHGVSRHFVPKLFSTFLLPITVNEKMKKPQHKQKGHFSCTQLTPFKVKDA